VGNVSIHNLCPEFLCAFGQPKSSVLSIFGQFALTTFLAILHILHLLLIRIIYKCLRNELPKETEHAINLPYKKAYIQAQHLLLSLKGAMLLTLYVATISSPISPPN
jgi:hypothetical protein